MFDATLPSIAAFAIIGLVGVYVVLDGFDLGVGILLMRGTTREDRDAMLLSTVGTRFSSEWWLIAAAVAMYFTFPLPFRALAQALPIPIGVMLVGLAVRAFAAAGRLTMHERGERTWSLIFSVASLVVAIAQGFCLCGYIKGVSVAGDRFVGGLFDWATPFSLLVAIALATGYGLLGAAWLMLRCRGEIAARAQRWTAQLSIAALCAMAAISAATLAVHPSVSARWGISLDGVEWRYFLPLAPLPLAATLCLALSFFHAGRAQSPWPFVGALGAFAAGYAGLAISIWPYIVPFGFTAAQSAALTPDLARSLVWIAAAIPCLAIISVLSLRVGRDRAGAANR